MTHSPGRFALRFAIGVGQQFSSATTMFSAAALTRAA